MSMDQFKEEKQAIIDAAKKMGFDRFIYSSGSISPVLYEDDEDEFSELYNLTCRKFGKKVDFGCGLTATDPSYLYRINLADSKWVNAFTKALSGSIFGRDLSIEINRKFHTIHISCDHFQITLVFIGTAVRSYIVFEAEHGDCEFVETNEIPSWTFGSIKGYLNHLEFYMDQLSKDEFKIHKYSYCGDDIFYKLKIVLKALVYFGDSMEDET